MNHWINHFITGPTRRDASTYKKSQNPGRNYSKNRISCSPIAIAANPPVAGGWGIHKNQIKWLMFPASVHNALSCKGFPEARLVLQICNSQKWNQMIDVSCVSRNNTSWSFFRIYVPFNDGSSDIEQNL